MAENTTEKYTKSRFAQFWPWKSDSRYFAIKFILLFNSFLLFNLTELRGQQVTGAIRDKVNLQALSNVSIYNKRTNDLYYSNTEGRFTIYAIPGDTLKFTLLGYLDYQYVVVGKTTDIGIVSMVQSLEVLDTVSITKPLTQYQKDSLYRREIFGKKVDQKPTKVDVVAVPLGIAVNGGITALAEKISRKYRQLKKFQKRYKENERELFAITRYATGLVKNLTALEEPQLTDFMQQYPVEPDFALAATDMEMNMWILYNYRQWQKKNQIMIDHN